MKLHKLKAGDHAGSYIVESPLTETDILRMAHQLARQRLSKGRLLSSPEQVFSHLKMLLQTYEHEVFAVLLLNTKHRVLGFHELFRGTLDETTIHPREVVKLVLTHNAATVILVHNHPSGDPEPSPADIRLTRALIEALNLVGTRTLDHVIVGVEGSVSLAERGFL